MGARTRLEGKKKGKKKRKKKREEGTLYINSNLTIKLVYQIYLNLKKHHIFF